MKSNRIIIALLCSTLCSAFLAANAQATASIIPLSVLFDNPEVSEVTISPDGKQLAFLAPTGDSMNIWVQHIDGSHKRCITHAKRSISSYFWGYDSTSIFYYQDCYGNENDNLCRVSIASGETVNLTPFPEVQVRRIHYSAKHPHRMLLGMNKERADIFDVYVLNTETGELTLYEKNPGYIAGFDKEAAWYANDELEVRLAYRFNEAGGTEVLYREHQGNAWEHLFTWDVNASAASTFIAFGPSPHEAYFADASETNFSQLVLFNFLTKEKKVLAQQKEFDIIAGSLSLIYDEHPFALINPHTSALAALIVQNDIPSTLVLDESLRKDFELLQNKGLGFMHVRSTDQSFTKWVVACVNDNRPVEYYLYDRTTQELQLIAASKPKLRAYECARTKPVAFSARDGLHVHGYLTYPTTTADRTNLPLVLMVHGGPWVRDEWGFSPRVKFLANRGYACLQVNYRGSSGYGTAFVKASNKQYAHAMQHDLIDGAQWLIDQGIVDARKVAIFGGSFGGYAALAGATFSPDFYACAISLYGPSSLLYSAQTVPAYWLPGLVVWKYRKGDPITEEAMMREQSPLFHADNIRIPMLIAHGAHDARVKQSQSDTIVEALKKRNIPCEYLLFSNEGHGLVTIESRLRFFGAVEAFLAQRLGTNEK